MSKYFRLSIILSLVITLSQAQTQLTVYNHGEALVKEQFSKQIQSGISEIEIERVAETLNPSSVKLGSDQDIQVLEQNYRYDLVDQNKLLKKYLEAEVTVILQNDNKISGTLLSYDNSTLVLKSRGGTDIIQRQFVGTIKCPTPSERLYVRPTLAWTLNAEKTGKVKFDLSYLTGGISWKAEYVAVLNQDESELDLSSWINLNNKSGKDYKEAKLKLVAGDLHRARPEQVFDARREKSQMMAMRGMPVVEERQFFEYHLYDIAFPVSVHNREEKQIQWLNPTLVKSQKRYVYQGTRDQFTNIPIKIMFTNDKETGTGVALPGGIVRLFKKDTDGALELIGEDNLKHTSKDDLVTLEVGEAFDVKGKREILDRRSKSDRYTEQDIRITLANRKDEAVEVEVIQTIGYRNWRVQDASHRFTKVDASRVKFTVPVPANKEVILTYTSRVDLK
ncbi:MAG: DUF4139 domain-containing protein [FCB group bacterium]|nr:DUF4139 domain-containing protein [FCB group bacterium]MBL7028338.1 DUF4139 domain-containing protein [Candidatus Neomarinimicrobiota bacterium]MBL7121657.1 DUF4139 domain-containing protein [Candidatus Neomarinimicrobiota bacterium]